MIRAQSRLRNKSSEVDGIDKDREEITIMKLMRRQLSNAMK